MEYGYTIEYRGAGSTYRVGVMNYEFAKKHAHALMHTSALVKDFNDWELWQAGWTVAENAEGVRVYIVENSAAEL